METKWKDPVESNNHLTQEETDYFDSQESIFYGAKFGDVFINAEGKRALYVGERYNTYICAVEDNIDDYSYYDADGHNQACKRGDDSFSIVKKQRNNIDIVEKACKWLEKYKKIFPSMSLLEGINVNNLIKDTLDLDMFRKAMMEDEQ